MITNAYSHSTTRWQFAFSITFRNGNIFRAGIQSVIPANEQKKYEICSHFPPHLHSSFECVYILSGSYELGIGEELFHMEEGDFAIVFPDLIHHSQVFDPGKCTAYYLIGSPSLSGPYLETMQQFCPEHCRPMI